MSESESLNQQQARLKATLGSLGDRLNRLDRHTEANRDRVDELRWRFSKVRGVGIPDGGLIAQVPEAHEGAAPAETAQDA